MGSYEIFSNRPTDGGENTSNSAMLNIAELVPLPESVPTNSGIQAIPIHHPLLVATDQTNSDTEFWELLLTLIHMH
jgi:hypothetical protein